jgi:sulfoxide reductase heme-binding subunit YedZ
VSVSSAALSAATGGGSALWYLARGTGVVVLVLLTLVVVLGILTRRGAGPQGQTFVLASVHRNASLLTVGLLAVHVVTAVLDPYATIRLLDAVIPFISSYRPVWLGLGAVAFDLLVALVVTSLLRLRIGVRVWRGIHWLAYLAWPVALVHGAGTGTDTSARWNLLIVAACVLAVASAAVVRARIIADARPGCSAAVRLTAIGSPLLFGGWLLLGPLAPGWAARSGTPVTLLAGARSAASSADPATPGSTAKAAAVPSGSARWNGQVSQRDDGQGGAVVVLHGALSGGPGGQLEIRLVGAPAVGGGVDLSSGTATLTLPGGGHWAGTVTGLDGSRIDARLSGGSGAGVSLAASVRISSSSTLSGTVVLR